jgi:hypothetical protein
MALDRSMGSLVSILALSLRNGCLVLVEGEEVSEWISIDAELPIQLSGNVCMYETIDVILTDGVNVGCGEFVTGCYEKVCGKEVWHEFRSNYFIATHWMNLPEPPK